MIETVSRWLAGMGPRKDREILRKLINPLADRYSTGPLTTAGLVITATTGKKVPKTGSAAMYLAVNGVLASIAAGTDMPALAGTVVNATFNVFCFFQDAGGTRTSAMGTAGAYLAAVKFPPFPEGKALLGFIIINPTGTGDFVGGTTALDDATVAPGTLYVSPTAPFDPTVLL